eukprot:TRINITY_DN109734_c0_g1_i1.p1 TRINITY_DN109734_c0_g1~~TRINITY_DN109734_c0_g1_i1.p1  ORF type:complete len:206 (-),score=9.73 TRINITY_DN109734_c0_g1_i1:97-687(-)
MAPSSDELLVPTGQNHLPELPCCVLWVPIPCFSHLFPVIGHTMITDSKGTLYDFAGYIPRAGNSGVCRNVGIFGPPVRMLQFRPHHKASAEDFSSDWDAAVAVANKRFERQVHMGFINNCHSHVATALNALRHSQAPRWLIWNSLVLGAAMACFGRFVPGKGYCFRVWYAIWMCVVIWFIFCHIGESGKHASATSR